MKLSNEDMQVAKDLALFREFVQLCESLGPRYNPSRDEVKLSALKRILADADRAMEAVRQTAIDCESALMEQNESLERLNKELINMGAPEETLELVRALAKKLR